MLPGLIKYAKGAVAGAVLTWDALVNLDGKRAQAALDVYDQHLIQSIDIDSKTITVEIETEEVRALSLDGWTVIETDRKTVLRFEAPKTADDVRRFIRDLYSAPIKLIRWRQGLAVVDDGELSPDKIDALDAYIMDAGICGISLLDSIVIMDAKYHGPKAIRVEGRMWEIVGDNTSYTEEIEDQDVIEVSPWEAPPTHSLT